MVNATCWSFLMQALGVDTEEDIYLLAQYLLKNDQTTEMPPAAGQDTEASQELERRESLASQRGKDQEGEKVVKVSHKDG